MFGAILGDIVGSPYEFNWNNRKSKEFPLFCERSHFTDDSVMTLAVGMAFLEASPDDSDECVESLLKDWMHRLGRTYPDAGYGRRFRCWLKSDDPQPYGSFGNGSAMRVSAVAWLYEDLDTVRHAARLSAGVTHDHPEGIKGAEAVASAIFLARTGKSKIEIRAYMEKEFDYDLSRTCSEIRPDYQMDATCQGSVPEAITAFLDGESFEDVLRTAVSLGGDSDTIAAMAGSIAEGYYGIDEDWKKAAFGYLPEELAQILRKFDLHCGTHPANKLNPVHEAILFAERAHRGQKRKGTDIEYIIHPMEVMQILSEIHAGREVQMAGVLHDTVEDTDVTIDEIQKRFGDRVAQLVANHTEDKSKSWQERKQHTIDILKTADRDTRLLIMADKISNLRSMASDYARVGETLWERFHAPKEQQSWYNNEIQDALYEMQFDQDARAFYWELIALYKELFVDFYADMEHAVLYQTACGLSVYVFHKEDGNWTESDSAVPPTAEKISCQRAERLEEYWTREYHNAAPDGNEKL